MFAPVGREDEGERLRRARGLRRQGVPVATTTSRSSRSVGGVPYIPFKSNSTSTGSAAWERMWHCYSLNKRRLPRALPQAQQRRVHVQRGEAQVRRQRAVQAPARRSSTRCLLKCLCFNLSMLVHSIHELGIEPKFWMPARARRSPDPERGHGAAAGRGVAVSDLDGRGADARPHGAEVPAASVRRLGPAGEGPPLQRHDARATPPTGARGHPHARVPRGPPGRRQRRRCASPGGSPRRARARTAGTTRRPREERHALDDQVRVGDVSAGEAARRLLTAATKTIVPQPSPPEWMQRLQVPRVLAGQRPSWSRVAPPARLPRRVHVVD